MILLDTSILIEYLRSKDAALWAKMQNQNASVCGVVQAEILAGARTASHRTTLLATLGGLIQAPDNLDWTAVGDNAAELRRQGVNLPLADIMIATFAIQLSIELWTRDAHFTHVQRILPALRLFVEPP